MGWIRTRGFGKPIHEVMQPGPKPAAAPAAGDFVESWRLDRLIHVGRFTSVFRAVANDARVGALKILTGDIMAQPTAGDRFAREIAALQGLSHERIPQLLDHGVNAEGQPWFVTEWLVGWDVETHRQRLGGRLSVGEVLDLGSCVLEALEHAHSRGLVHRDVKPANLFLTETGELKVLDFGVCRALAAAMVSGITGNVILGTPGFIAPEQAARQWSLLDARTDVWSVGASLFVLLTGRPVHEGTPEEQRRLAYQAKARSVASIAPELPPDLVEVVDRALLLDPNQRWQTARAMQAALRGAIRDTAPPAAPDRFVPSSRSARHLVTTEQDRDASALSEKLLPTLLRVVSSPDSRVLRERMLSCHEPLLIGRDPADELWSISDTRVSRVHVRIAWDERQGCHRAIDQQSTNGVRINGVRRTNATLSHGDVLRVGDTLLVVIEASRANTTLAAMEQAAKSPATVLITGETGVGKEVLARKIHEASGRAGPFVPINCGALPRDLAASELFGHIKGAFSGAGAARRGIFQAAEGGTLLLDEIGELPLDLQPLLLRALQQRAIRPVGADREFPIDVRVLAATNVRLEDAVTRARFRADLHARLVQIPIHIPALRERREEILELVGHFASAQNHSLLLTADAAEALLLWKWPYNVREVENLMQRFCAYVPSGTPLNLQVFRTLVPAIAAYYDECTQARPSASSPDLNAARNPLSDRNELAALLLECDGNVSEIARRLNTTRAQVYRWMARLGLTPTRSGGSGGP